MTLSDTFWDSNDPLVFLLFNLKAPKGDWLIVTISTLKTRNFKLYENSDLAKISNYNKFAFNSHKFFSKNSLFVDMLDRVLSFPPHMQIKC